MTITLYWWMLPIALLIIGGIASKIFYKMNYQGGGSFGGDWFTSAASAAIFIGFVLLALGITLGKLL